MELPEATILRLESQHLIIRELVSGLTEQQIEQQIYTGKWTLKQQLAHLVSYQDMFFERVQLIMNSFNAVFSPYVAEDDAGFHNASRQSVPQLLENLNSMRNTINGFYFNLNSGELYRKGRHTHYGNFSIALWAEFFLLHEAHHILYIFQMNRQLIRNTGLNSIQPNSAGN